MPGDITSIQQRVIEALAGAANTDSGGIDGRTEIVLLVDSLRFLMALSEIQEVLGIVLEPDQVLELLRCRSIADIANKLEQLCATCVSQ